jgi:hypothetical protein
VGGRLYLFPWNNHALTLSLIVTTWLCLFVWALLIIFLFVCTFERRRLTIVESHCNNPGGVLEFKNCHPLARKDAISTGMEVLAHLVRLKNAKRPQACFEYLWSSHVLLLLGGDVELNPGDDVQPKCDLCMNLVEPQEYVVICQECNLWFHKLCCAFSEAANDVLSSSFCAWLCPKCNSPNYLESFLNSFSSGRKVAILSGVVLNAYIFQTIHRTETEIASFERGRLPLSNDTNFNFIPSLVNDLLA